MDVDVPPANEDALGHNAPPANESVATEHAPPADKDAAADCTHPANKEVATDRAPPADKDAAADPAPPADKDAAGFAPPTDKNAAASYAPPMDMDVPPAEKGVADNAPPVLPSSPPVPRISCPAKYQAVLKLFDTVVEGGIWKSAVDAWLALEHASGFQIAGKALSAKGRPEAVSWWVQRGRSTVQIPAGLDSEDEREDFYDGVVLWWLGINPAWRKEGVTKVEDFETHGLSQCSGGDLAGIPSGLNGLTSVLASLGWWYRIAEVAEGSLRWRKLMEDVVWVLTEKRRALAHKRGACDTSDNRTSKRTRVE
jgi:hypothetical protein